MKNKSDFKQGVQAGVPICLGYLSVSFAFGMMAQSLGMPVWMAVFISMSNLTSAGQFAGLKLIAVQGAVFEIALSTLVINLRYMLMSLSLSQKFESKMKLSTRCLLAFGITDEIFAVAMQHERAVSKSYFIGLLLTPYLGWTLGTFLGASASAFIPGLLASSLQIALYGMFLAIIIPEAKKEKPILVTVIFATILSILFYYCPLLNQLSGGWVIIIIAILVSSFVAYRYPIQVKENEHGF